MHAIVRADTQPGVAGAPPAGYDIVQDRVYGKRRIMRAQSPLAGVTGERAYLHVGSGMSVSASNMRHAAPSTETITGGGVIKVHTRLAGASKVGIGNQCGQSVGIATCSALIHPRGEPKIERFDADIAERSVTVACTAAFLHEEFGLDQLLPTPSPIARFLDGREDSFYSLDLPLQWEMRRAGSSILDDFSCGSSEIMLIEARALEILGRFFQQICADASPPAGTPLRPRDRRMAMQARDMLDALLGEPPSLGQLAREVGTHQAKLMRIFKAVHGTTISGYMENARMERARDLLVTEGLSVTQVAFELGYQHPGNFTTAFKRHYGILPSAMRPGR